MSPGATSAVVLGGSVAGSAAALQLARKGWEVTLVDPELTRFQRPGPVPAIRPGAPQAVHAHGFGSRTHVELRDRMPDLWDALVEAGAGTVPMAQMVPPVLYDGGRPGDDDMVALQARRHTFDRVLAETVAEEKIATVPQRATGLLLDHSGAVTTVRGLTLEGNQVLPADVTIDAGGRRSPVTGWLQAAGLRQQERFDESIARYYSRHYAIEGARPPLNSGFADIHGFTCHVQLLFLGDNDTAMLALAAHDEDPILKVLRHAPAFEALVGANEGFAAWRAVLTPVSDIFCLGAFDNRMRSLVDGGQPLVQGLHQVGDALAMTNPTRGRGVSMGLLTVGALVDLLTEELAPDVTALAFDDWRMRVLLPYYRECATTDSIAAEQLRAGLAGKTVPNNAPAVELPEGHPISSADLERAADTDPDLFRVLIRASVMLDDDRQVASAEVADRVRRVLADDPPRPQEPPRSDGLHDRSRVETLLAAYA